MVEGNVGCSPVTLLALCSQVQGGEREEREGEERERGEGRTTCFALRAACDAIAARGVSDVESAIA